LSEHLTDLRRKSILYIAAIKNSQGDVEVPKYFQKLVLKRQLVGQVVPSTSRGLPNFDEGARRRRGRHAVR
jgi:hypothetical protein